MSQQKHLLASSSIVLLVVFACLCLPSCGQKPAGLYHKDVNIKATGGGKDLVMTFDEVERNEKYSIVKVRHTSGASVPSIMFVTKGFYEMAELRGVGYFVNLKEWTDKEKNWLYKVGFSADRNVDPKTHFGEDIDLSKDLRLASVRQFALLFRGEVGTGTPGNAGRSSKESVRVRINELNDPKPLARWRAADSLGALGPEAKESVPALIKALIDANADVRSAAAEALGKIGPDSKDAVPALIKALGDTDGGVRKGAVDALVLTGAEAKEVVPALVKALGDPVADVRASAASALSAAGPGAKEAVPALLRTLGDPEDFVRMQAAFALCQIRPDGMEAIEALTKSLSDRYDGVRTFAAEALGWVGPGAKPAIPDLERLADKDPDEDVRKAAKEALEKIRK